jgi:hypothetical protein
MRRVDDERRICWRRRGRGERRVKRIERVCVCRVCERWHDERRRGGVERCWRDIGRLADDER